MKNIVIITADDCSACSIDKDHSPNIWAFRNNAVQFLNAHCNITFCQPSRSVLMTGLYPQNNGSTKFCSIKQGIATLPKILKDNNYFTGIIGKTFHHQPYSVYQWDFEYMPMHDIDNNSYTEKIIYNLKKIIKHTPFFALINIRYPHRPFIKVNSNLNFVKVPMFLKDDIATRQELANYYESVKELDRIFKEVINVLDEDTHVIFTSDHGMSFPFVKGNCYHYSTNIPLIYKINGMQGLNSNHLVSHVDFTPTILDLLNIRINIKFDGQSYKKLIETGEQENFEFVYAQLNQMSCGPPIRMRSIISKDYTYVVNIDKKYPAYCVDGWGWHEFIKNYQFCKRNTEELIELKTNKNLASVEINMLRNMRKKLISTMKKYKDPLTKEMSKIINLL